MKVARVFLIAVVAVGIGVVGATAADKAAEPQSETAAAYILKGQELYADKKLEECREAFQKAAELEPNNLTAKMGQFAILAELGRPDEGLAVLDKWIEAKPDDPQRWGASFTPQPMQNVPS